MDLFIIRHAWAGRYGDPRWPDDELRPLTAEGKKRFARVVKALAERGFAPELIAASPLVRCVQTAEIVAAGLSERPEIVEHEALRPGGDLAALLQWTTGQARRHRRIAWVGHAPDVCRHAAALVGDANAWIRFAKAGVALVRFPGRPHAGEGELRWLATARMLGC